MNEYLFSNIETGMEESFNTLITEDFMNSFRNITKDTNPLHLDEDFAKSKGHKDKVVFGMLTASFFSTLAGVYMPGKHSLIHSVETKFLKPVYVGDELTISGKVKEKNDLFKFIVISAVIKNQHNEKVCKAIMKVGIDNG